MKTLYNTALLIVLTLSCFTIEARERKGKYTKKKEISKNYTIGNHFDLLVDNIYGEVKIETWDKKEVAYQINIISNGDDLEKVEQRLKDIHIAIEESKSKLSLITHIDYNNKKHSTFTSFVKGLINGESTSYNSSHIEINYIIHLPKDADLDITNDYGFIYIDETKGNTRIDSEYGGLIAEALLSSSNDINLDFSSNSDIMHLRQADLNISYSSVHMHHVGYLDLNSDFCSTKIDSVKDINFSIEFGSLAINKGRKIEGSADHVQLKFGEIDQYIDLNMSYGGVKINQIKRGFNLANIQADFAAVKVGVDYSEAFILDVKTSFSSLKGTQAFTPLYSNDDDYKGYNKSKDTTKRISIDANYGSVSVFSAH